MPEPILALAGLEEVFGDDRAGLIELVDMVVAADAQTLAPLRVALSAHDATALREAAHGIKGAAANVGALAVSAAAHALEDLARSASWPDVPAAMRDLEAAVVSAREALEAYRAGST